MNIKHNFHSIFLACVSAAVSIGCDGTEAGASEAEGAPTTDSGLSIARWEPDRVEGTFSSDGATVRFEVERVGLRRTARIDSVEGEPLIEATVERNFETIELLGGRAVLQGDDPSNPPQVNGDASALAELAEMPEAGCIGKLLGALEEAGVDPDLVGPQAEAVQATPRYYLEGSWYVLGPGETYTFGTWFWSATRIQAVTGPSYSNPISISGCVSLQAGLAKSEDLCFSTSVVEIKRTFVGIPVHITNLTWKPNFVKVRTL